MLIDILLVLLAYLLGSISSAVIVCKLLKLPDPRTFGSHNPGATNVLRTGDRKAAIITLVGDIIKGFIPVYICQQITNEPALLVLVAMAAFLGHLYPVFFHFQGGKGVATALGVILALSGKVALALLLTWLLIAYGFRLSSLAALMSAMFAPLYFYLLIPEPLYWCMSAGISSLLIWRHRSNIQNLINRNESQINS